MFLLSKVLPLLLLPLGEAHSAFQIARAKRLFERQGLRVLPFPVDFQVRGTWAGNPLGDPLNWIPSVKGLDSSSRALREAIGRPLYRAW